MLNHLEVKAVALKTFSLDELWDNWRAKLPEDQREAFDNSRLQGQGDAASFIFGWNIRDMRIEQGLTQMQLSEITGIQQREITRIENGNANPTLRTIQRLMLALGHELTYVPVKRPIKKKR